MRADARVFNVGYEAGEVLATLRERPKGSGHWFAVDGAKAVPPCETSLSPELLGAVARVRGTITTTIYPPMKWGPPQQTPGRGS